ncbi:hypothetical protein DXG03_001393 [Asterophora parasitica]|uniref:Phospholipase C/P1 nuclease n=1 Tax=Asterophora parasitica TaxID=117018 RepID=A0A9P7FXB2_9AGAR|nr:hypothetical protein DXG03_001393 [Asterophora parasitica]
MRLTKSVLLLGGITSRLPEVFGWGAAGHEIVATIAQIHMDPTVYPVLCDILNYTSSNPREPLCHLAPIASWADRFRYRMGWSGPLHYVGAVDDYPSQTCAFPGNGGWAGERRRNVLGAVRNFTDILEAYISEGSVGRDTANEAAKFLVHFLGDLHMPLHLTGRDRGGNDDKVKFGGRTTSTFASMYLPESLGRRIIIDLHAVWDGLLIAKAIRETPYNYTMPLPSPQIEWALRGAIYDPYIRRIMWEGILDQWKDEVSSWITCPQPRFSSSSGGGFWQTVMRMFSRNVGGETDDEVLCPYHWAQPIHELNCDVVWPRELDQPPYKNVSLSKVARYGREDDDCHHDDHDDEHDLDIAGGGPYLQLDTPEYAGAIKERLVVEKLLAQAGIRLAAVLNWLLAEIVEDGRTSGLRLVQLQNLGAEFRG